MKRHRAPKRESSQDSWAQDVAVIRKKNPERGKEKRKTNSREVEGRSEGQNERE